MAYGYRVVSVREDLIVPLTGVDPDRMLEFWRWLVPPSHQPLFATALGDLFLAAPDGRVLWLDVGSGELRPVAATDAEFQRSVTDLENNSLWFGAVLVDKLRAAGKVLGPGECYSYWMVPILGGEYEPANFTIYPVERHFQVWGPIHEKLRDVPDGTEVMFEVVNRPEDRSDAESGAGPDAAGE
jgi:hypothetical protein